MNCARGLTRSKTCARTSLRSGKGAGRSLRRPNVAVRPFRATGKNAGARSAGHRDPGPSLASRRGPDFRIGLSAFKRPHLVLERRQRRGDGGFQPKGGKLRVDRCVRGRGPAFRHQIGKRREQARDEDRQRTVRAGEQGSASLAALGAYQCRRHEPPRFGRAVEADALCRLFRCLAMTLRANGVRREPTEPRILALETRDACTRTLNVETQRGNARRAPGACRPRPDPIGGPEEFRTTASRTRRTGTWPLGRPGLPRTRFCRVGGDEKSGHIDDQGLAEAYRRASVHQARALGRITRPPRVVILLPLLLIRLVPFRSRPRIRTIDGIRQSVRRGAHQDLSSRNPVCSSFYDQCGPSCWRARDCPP
jgi:hypothetical protein